MQRRDFLCLTGSLVVSQVMLGTAPTGRRPTSSRHPLRQAEPETTPVTLEAVTLRTGDNIRGSLPLRVDERTSVTYPEWQSVVREGEPGTPAAYFSDGLRHSELKLRASFRQNDGAVHAFRVRATPTSTKAGLLGNVVESPLIEFGTAGLASNVELSLADGRTSSSPVGIYPVEWTWECQVQRMGN